MEPPKPPETKAQRNKKKTSEERERERKHEEKVAKALGTAKKVAQKKKLDRTIGDDDDDPYNPDAPTSQRRPVCKRKL